MKKINNLKLLVFLGFVVSCTPNLNSTSSSSKPTNTEHPKPSISSPSAPITNITPIPTALSSPNPDYKNLKVKEIRIYNGNTIIASKNFETQKANENNYNILFGESINLTGEIIYENGLINKNIIWKSENPNSVSVDNTGLIKTESQFGESYISLIDINDSSLNFGITVNYLPTLSKTEIIYRDCEYKNVTFDRPRFEPYTTRNGVVYDESRETYQGGPNLATFNGKVFDPYGTLIEGATVNAVSTVPNNKWRAESQVTVGGAYVVRNAYGCDKIAITVTKDGWTTRTREVILRTDLQGDPTANIFDFKGLEAIQDEPEIVQIKVNGNIINKSSKDDEFLSDLNKPKNIKPTPEQMENNFPILYTGNIPDLTGVNSDNINIEMTFSEPIKVDDIKNYFRLTSQINNGKSFIINGQTSGVTFDVSPDERIITFQTNKAVLSNKEGKEANYLIDFSEAFRDKTDKLAIDKRYFRFSNSQVNDFAVFSVKND